MAKYIDASLPIDNLILFANKIEPYLSADTNKYFHRDVIDNLNRLMNKK